VLDALGTLVDFDDPVPRLRAELVARLGLEVSAEAAAAAMRAEIRFYAAEHDRASDAAGLQRLRLDCGRVIRAALAPAADDAPVEELAAALVAAIRFAPFPEVPATLAALRARGARLVVASNWDVSLHAVLADTGLAAHLDAVLTSAEEGCAKPDPRLLLRALARAGIEPGAAIHAGDSVEHDVAAARAAGVRPVLVARHGEAPPPGVTAVPALDGLLTLAST
jgi:putative hydrolase of the HAD superfamily